MKKLCLFLILASILFGCNAGRPNLGDTIIGKWVDDSGYEIHFFKEGKGFIPGVPGKIPDTNFMYTIVDNSHITFTLQQSKVTVEIQIDGDKLTWKDDIGEVVYHRKN